MSELKSATNALILIRRRDQRAWPIAEVLAEMWQRGALRRALDELTTPDEVFVPTTRPAPNAGVREVGALGAWHGELRRGFGGQRANQPATWHPTYRNADGEWTDPLRAAAAREAEGRDFDRQGLREVGDRCRQDAAHIMATAAKQLGAA